MTHYALAFGWGLLLLAAFAGWGLFLGRRVLRIRELGLGAGPAIGIGFAVALGGCLNLLALISPKVIFAWVGAGVSMGLVEVFRRTEKSSASSTWTRWSVLAGLGVAGVILLRYSGSVQPVQLNEFDDMTGYLVFPVRMLQTGEIGRDPFNARRLESTLGGMSFIHAMMMVRFPEQNAPLADLGVGLLAAVAAACELGRSRRLAGSMLIPLALMVAYDPTPLTNITAVLTGVALMLALVRAVEVEGAVWSRVTLVSLLAAALCSIKSSYVPITVLFLAFHYGSRVLSRRVLIEGLAVLAVTSALMVPWMVAMYASSGTLLYPLLGKGYHGSVYGTFTPPSAGLGGSAYLKNLVVGLTDPVAMAAWVGAASALVWMIRERKVSVAAAAFFLAALVDTLVLLRLFEFIDALRYLAPVYTVCLVVALAQILEVAQRARTAEGNGGASARLAGALMAASFVVAFALGVSWWPSRSLLFKPMVQNTLAGLRGYHFTTEAERAEIRQVQDSIPPGEAVVVWSTKPYLFDFGRNSISVLDWPGVSSLPPGIPIQQDPEPLARYFVDQKIRYLVLAPSIRSLYPATLADVEKMPSGWSRAVSVLAIRFFEQIEALRPLRKKVYSSDRYIVLDLAQPNP